LITHICGLVVGFVYFSKAAMADMAFWKSSGVQHLLREFPRSISHNFVVEISILSASCVSDIFAFWRADDTARVHSKWSIIAAFFVGIETFIKRTLPGSTETVKHFFFLL